MHERMASVLDTVVGEIAALQHAARVRGTHRAAALADDRAAHAEGLDRPEEVDGLPAEGTWRSHQVPLAEVRTNPGHLAQLEEWLRSYRPEELFDDDGALVPELAALPPRGDRRMSANPHANGGLLLRGARAARLPRLRGRRRRAGRDARARRRACSAASCAT